MVDFWELDFTSHDKEDKQQNAAAEDVFEEIQNLDNTGVTEEEDDETESDENNEVQYLDKNDKYCLCNC